MKSRTSFFNWMLLRKNVTRFSPIWIAYLMIGLLTFPVNFAIQLSDEHYPPDVMDISRFIGSFLEEVGPAVACIYGLVIAMAVFSYLYHARSVSMMHSLPVRRSGLFITNYVSGLLFILVPNAVVALLVGAVTLLGGVFCPGMIAGVFLMLSGLEIFFFSMATFVAMFTGHLVALPIFYGIFNGLFAGLYLCIMAFAEPYLFGIASFEINILSDLIQYLTPLWHFYETVEFNYTYNKLGELIGTELCGGVGVAVYTIVGFALAALAYAVYRKRRSESAGDVVSVGWAKILFRYGVGICAAFSVGQGLYYAIFDGVLGTFGKLLCMILVGAIGFYVAQILLHKSFRVLKKSVLGSGICAAVVLAVFAGACFDVTGFTRYIPDADKVESVFVRVSGYGYSEGKVQEEQSVETAIAIHQYIVDHRWELEREDWPYYTDDGQGANYGITYYMKNGSSVYRSYYIPVQRSEQGDETTLTGMLEKLVDQDEFRAASFLRELYTAREDYAILSGAVSYYTQWDQEYYNQTYSYGSKEAMQLYDAILEDIMQGRTHKIWLLKPDEEQEDTRYMNEVFFTCRHLTEGYEQNFSIEISSGMTSTLEAMEALGITDERAPLITREEYYKNVEEWERVPYDGEASYAVYG